MRYGAFRRFDGDKATNPVGGAQVTATVQHSPDMQNQVVPDHPEIAHVTQEHRPDHPQHTDQFLLVAVLVHDLNKLAVADAQGAYEVQIVLTVAAIVQIEGGHLDTRLISPRSVFGQRLDGAQTDHVVSLGRVRPLQELRDLPRCDEGYVARQYQNRMTRIRRSRRQRALKPLQDVLQQGVSLRNDVDAAILLGVPSATAGFGQSLLQPDRISDHEDLADLRGKQKRLQDVHHHRSPRNLQERFALAVD